METKCNVFSFHFKCSLIIVFVHLHILEGIIIVSRLVDCWLLHTTFTHSIYFVLKPHFTIFYMIDFIIDDLLVWLNGFETGLPLWGHITNNGLIFLNDLWCALVLHLYILWTIFILWTNFTHLGYTTYAVFINWIVLLLHIDLCCFINAWLDRKHARFQLDAP